MFMLLKSLAKRDVEKFNELAGSTLATFNDRLNPALFAVTKHGFEKINLSPSKNSTTASLFAQMSGPRVD